MFRKLLAHPQEALGILRAFHSSPGSRQLTQHACNMPSAACVAPPEDEQVMLETCRGP
jgi:hypothetical protein